MASKRARIVPRSSVKKKTSIGVVGRIIAAMVVRCGGAVASRAKKCQGASSESTKARKMKKTTTRRKSKRLLSFIKKSMCAVHAANRSVIPSMNVHEIPISKQGKSRMMSSQEFKN